MTRVQKFKIVFIVCILGFVAIPAFAAKISFDSEKNEWSVGQEIKIDIILNTEEEKINAVEGEIIFSADLLILQELRNANSIVNFWVEQPKLASEGKIFFSGIIPGGFQGENGLLVSLVLSAKTMGQGMIKLEKIKALRNNGQGTEAGIKISNFQFLISKQIMATETQAEIETDRERPEPFMPKIACNPDIFNNQWFVAFATQDKQTGIAYYKVKEAKQKIFIIFSKWVTTTSPYLLRDQQLTSHIFIKAVDEAGNERFTEIPPQNPLKWYENIENIIILLIIFILSISIKFLWKRKFLLVS